MEISTLIKAFEAFKREDARLQSLPETQINGNPFTICTNGAKWLQENIFPNVSSKIMGYHHEDNSEAEIGKWTLGHDFLVIEDRYIVDFWYRHVQGVFHAPLVVDMRTQKTVLKQYYGDPANWETILENKLA